MGFKDIINQFGKKAKERKQMIKDLDEKLRIQKLVEDRQKSSNERELERFMKEDREESIKEQLQAMRKKRQKDIAFGHNPLDTPNITNHTDWEVLKERNLFSGKGNMFTKSKSILNNNPNLLKNNMRLMS